MPYSRGMSLQRRIVDRGSLPVVEVLRIGSQIAAGLAAAHAQGLVHRDIKPANILVNDGVDRLVITDFGLARAVDDASVTRTGVIAGTPQYMSPEQARGESIDHRSDLFSLGSVLYALCTGRPPFRRGAYGILRRITDNEPRPIREINPEIPEWLCSITRKLMSKQVNDRYQTAEEVSKLLEDCLAHVQQPTVVPVPAALASHVTGRSFFTSYRRGVIAMFSVLGLALLGMMLWQGTEPPDIAGEWTGDEWGTVVLEAVKPTQYTGSFQGVDNSKDGSITLNWSRVERRFNGSWQEGKDSKGRLSLRLVGDDIRGGWTADKATAKDSGWPRLGDFAWRRSVSELVKSETRTQTGEVEEPTAHDQQTYPETVDRSRALQGEWEYLSYEQDGVVKEYKPEQRMTLSISGDRWAVGPMPGPELSHKVSVSKRTLVFRGVQNLGPPIPGETTPQNIIAFGIYALNDDSFSYCMTPFVAESGVMPGTASPIKEPTSFKTSGTSNTLYRLRRKR